MVLACGIYCVALTKAWRNRRALAGLFNPLNENPFGAMITTDVEIVSSNVHDIENDDCHALAESPKAPYTPKKGDSSFYHANIHAQDAVQSRQNSRPHILRVGTLTRNAALGESNAEAWLFARVAFLFFVVMMLCWIPASINRLYSTIERKKLVFGLNYMAALMLPLQGFLNAIVYAVSSQSAVRSFFGVGLRMRSANSVMPGDRVPRSNYVEVFESHRKSSADQQRSHVPR